MAMTVVVYWAHLALVRLFAHPARQHMCGLNCLNRVPCVSDINIQDNVHICDHVYVYISLYKPCILCGFAEVNRQILHCMMLLCIYTCINFYTYKIYIYIHSTLHIQYYNIYLYILLYLI